MAVRPYGRYALHVASGDEAPDEDSLPAEKDLPHEAAPRFKATRTSFVEGFRGFSTCLAWFCTRKDDLDQPF